MQILGLVNSVQQSKKEQQEIYAITMLKSDA